MKPTVILTRPDGDNAALEARLLADGWSTLTQPVLRIAPLDDALRMPPPVLASGDYCVFISANAVRMGLPDLLAGLRENEVLNFAVGARTAAALEQEGLPVTMPSRPDSEGLLALPELQSVTGRRVIIVKGHGGRGLLAAALRERGAEVIEYSCYVRQPEPVDPDGFCARLQEQPSLVFQANSGETLEYLSGLLARCGDQGLFGYPVIVPSERIAKYADECGWEQVITAANASDDAFVKALQDMDDVPLTGDATTMIDTVNTDSETTATSDVATPDSGLPSSSRGGADWFARTLLLLLILALAGAGGFGYVTWWPEWLARGEQAGSVDARLTAVTRSNASLAESLSGQVSQELMTAQGEVKATLTQELAAVTRQRLQDNARFDALTARLDRLELRLARLTATDRRAWLANEAAFLVRLAAQRLLASRDIGVAEALLENADALLQEVDDPRFDAARRALAADRSALRAAPRVDTVGLYARFAALVGQSAALQVEPASPAVDPVAEATSWYSRAEAGWQAALAKLSNYLVVRRRDSEMAKMMTPDWEALVRQNLRMLLEQAQIAALSGNQSLYDTALQRAAVFVDEFAEVDPERSAAIHEELASLADLSIAPSLPSLTATRAALADAIRLLDVNGSVPPSSDSTVVD